MDENNTFQLKFFSSIKTVGATVPSIKTVGATVLREQYISVKICIKKIHFS